MTRHSCRLNLYPLAEHRALAAHLEKMARRGWRLRKYGGFLLTYQKAEPADLRYAVTFFSDPSAGDVLISQKRFPIERARQNGWELVWDDPYRPLQIFSTADAAAPPIEPDPRLEFLSVNAMLRRHLCGSPRFAVFLLVPLLEFLLPGYYMMQNLARTDFCLLLLLAFLTLFYKAGECLWYLRWRGRAKAAAEAGRPIPPCGGPLRRVLLALLYGLGAVILGAYCVGPGALRPRRLIPLAALFFVALVQASHLAAKKFKDNKYGVKQLFTLLLMMPFLLAAAALTGFGRLAASDVPMTLDAGAAAVTAQTLEQTPEYTFGPYVSRSPAASYLVCQCTFGQDQAPLEYEVCDIPWSWLRSHVVKCTVRAYRMTSDGSVWRSANHPGMTLECRGSRILCYHEGPYGNLIREAYLP